MYAIYKQTLTLYVLQYLLANAALTATAPKNINAINARVNTQHTCTIEQMPQ